MSHVAQYLFPALFCENGLADPFFVCAKKRHLRHGQMRARFIERLGRFVQM